MADEKAKSRDSKNQSITLETEKKKRNMPKKDVPIDIEQEQ